MQRDIVDDIIRAIKSSSLWDSRSYETGGYLNFLCPKCGELSAFVYQPKPFAIHCNRLNNCGESTPVKAIFPELYTDVEKRKPATEKEPNRPAIEFLSLRGLEHAAQFATIRYSRNVRNSGSGAVMFHVADHSWNGRLFNPGPDQGKTHNEGPTSGKYWKPITPLDPSKPVYIVEGIIEALSLMEAGFQAISPLSCKADPDKITLETGFQYVIAFNSDTAGKSGLRRWAETKRLTGILPPVNLDWNDLLIRHGTDGFRDFFNQNMQSFIFHARLATAKTPEEYAAVYFDYAQKPSGLFEFDFRYYQSSLEKKKGAESVTVKNVSDFILETDHYQLDATVKDEPEYRYCLIARKKGEPEKRFIAMGRELSSPQGLRTVMTTRARSWWGGDQRASDELVRRICARKDKPEIRQVQSIGYDHISGCYLFPEFGVTQSGTIVRKSKSGFFELSRSDYVRPCTARAAIIPDFSSPQSSSQKTIFEILRCIDSAWPGSGAIATGWTIASWFVHIIRQQLRFFPFLSLRGDPQTGKSTLITILNRLQCIDEEGLPLNSANTTKGELRQISQRSSLFQGLIEGNRASSRFDSAMVSMVLPLYNHGNPLQVRAAKSNDNTLVELPFRSALLFSQNAEPFVSRAQRERFISLDFRKDLITRTTTLAIDQLRTFAPSEFAGFFSEVMKYRLQIERSWFDHFETTRKTFTSQGYTDARITENHSIPIAILSTLETVAKGSPIASAGLCSSALAAITERMAAKTIECRDESSTVADMFFDLVFQLSETDRDAGEFIRKSDDGAKLYIRVPECLSRLKGYSFGPNLYHELETHFAFVKKKISWRFTERGALDPKQTAVKSAWEFDYRKIQSGSSAGSRSPEGVGV